MRHFKIVDVKSNGLLGEPFAIAAVILDEFGRIADSFYGRCPIYGDVVPFVSKHVLPALPSGSEHPSLAHLCRAFWTFHVLTQTQFECEVWADIPFPVKTRFFQRCVELDPSREMDLPFPLLDVATAMVVKGWDPMRSREDFCTEDKIAKHYRDVYASGVCMLRSRGYLGPST